MVKDFAAHAFQNKKMNEEFMMKGFTPFCIQQLDDNSKINLILHEEWMAQTTTTSYSNLEKKSKKLKITPISDILGFITINSKHACIGKSPVLHNIFNKSCCWANKKENFKKSATSNQTTLRIWSGQSMNVVMISSRCACHNRICWKVHVSKTPSEISITKFHAGKRFHKQGCQQLWVTQ